MRSPPTDMAQIIANLKRAPKKRAVGDFALGLILGSALLAPLWGILLS